MSSNVQFCENVTRIVEDDARSPAPQRGSDDDDAARSRCHAGRRSYWRWAPLVLEGVGGVGSVALWHPSFFVVVGTVTGVVVVLFVIGWLGLLLWTAVYGGLQSPQEQVFRLMRFFAAREEPSVPVLAPVPAQASRARTLSSAQGQAAEPGPGSARVCRGASQHPAAGMCSRGSTGMVGGAMQDADRNLGACPHFPDTYVHRCSYARRSR